MGALQRPTEQGMCTPAKSVQRVQICNAVCQASAD